jgi:anthranilate synthase/aminodeoxychorismate synthase-like glutamine amidotransferase
MGARPRVLVVDNHDSFTFNLVDAFATLGAGTDVVTSDASPDEVLRMADERRSTVVVISPGPGVPEDAGCSPAVVRAALGRLPLFGVCLGHQVLVTTLGGEVGPAGEIVHGRTSRVRHDDHPLFDGVPEHFEVGRYHSLAALRVPPDLDVIARHGPMVMAVAHRHAPAWGVQFHAESILTVHGPRILGNVLRLAAAARSGGSIFQHGAA